MLFRGCFWHLPQIESSWVREKLRIKRRSSNSTYRTAEMERVLKRVGLSKKSQSDLKNPDSNTTNDDTGKIRRRRRSKSRRRSNHQQQQQDNKKKTRGIFNIDWESVKDCKSCKSRALTKRFCSKRSDNELYRSNSFKFERFIRGNEEVSTLGKKVRYPQPYRWVFSSFLGWDRLPPQPATNDFIHETHLYFSQTHVSLISCLRPFCPGSRCRKIITITYIGVF